MNRRLAFVIAAAVTLGGLGVGHAHADSAIDTPMKATAADEEYWACVAIDYVEVGTCVGNLFPDLTDYGTLPGIIGGVTDGLPTGAVPVSAG